MLILGLVLMAESILLLTITSVIWQDVIGIISLVWASGLIALWIRDNQNNIGGED